MHLEITDFFPQVFSISLKYPSNRKRILQKWSKPHNLSIFTTRHFLVSLAKESTSITGGCFCVYLWEEWALHTTKNRYSNYFYHKNLIRMPRTERERERKVASKGMQRVKYLINGGQYIFVLMANGSSTNMEAEDSCALHVSFIRLLCAPKMPCHWNSKLTNCPHTRISSTRFHIILNSRTCRFINQSRDTNKIPLCFHRCHHPSTRAILPSEPR